MTSGLDKKGLDVTHKSVKKLYYKDKGMRICR